MLILPPTATAIGSIEPGSELKATVLPAKQTLTRPPIPSTAAGERPSSKEAPATALAPYLLQNLQQLAGRTSLVSTRLSRLLRDNGLKSETPKLDAAAVGFAQAARRYYTEQSEEARAAYHSAADGLFAAEDGLWAALETKRSHGSTTESGGPLGTEASLGRFMQALSPYFPPE
jgi:hypothetical protein